MYSSRGRTSGHGTRLFTSLGIVLNVSNRLVTEICESFKLWSELDELERLMQFDIIPGMLDLIRSRLIQLGVECQEKVRASYISFDCILMSYTLDTGHPF